MMADLVDEAMLDLPMLRRHVENNPEQNSCFAFTVKFDHVNNRSVRRSLDYEDNGAVYGIRCVPLGHRAMFYLLRSSLPDYTEFSYDYTIVSGDGNCETGFGRRAFVNPLSLTDEFLDGIIDIPVNPHRNWFLINIVIRYLRPERDYWFVHPLIPSVQHPLSPLLFPDGNEVNDSNFSQITRPKHIDELVPTFPSFSKRLLNVFTDECFPDCKIRAGKAVFPAHKCVLAAHCIVFRCMFSHSCTVEFRTDSVTIEGILPEAVLVMLQWFYTGELAALDDDVAKRFLPPPDRISNTHPLDMLEQKPVTAKPPILNTEVLLDVLELANKYALDDLEYLAEQVAIERLNEKNCCQLLYLAHLFSLFSLKISAANTIRNNQSKILQSDDWKQLNVSESELCESIFAT